MDLSFAVFFHIWADIEGWDIPELHWDIIKFLDETDDYKWNHRSAVLQVFRGAGKSTILGLYIAYIFVKDPTLRILVLSGTSKTAHKVVADVKKILRIHPLAKHLYNPKGDKWTISDINIKGTRDPRNFSLSAIGILGSVTGNRADVIIHDDVEIPKNCDTAYKQETLRALIAEASALLIPDVGKRLFVGTPHSFDSIYPEYIEFGFSSLRIPLLTDYTGEWPNIIGTSAWPTRMTPSETFKAQTDQGTKGAFFSQYLLIPSTIEDSILDPKRCKEYSHDIRFHYANKIQSAYIDDVMITGVSCYWDISPANKGGDDSVIAIVYFTDDNDIYIHRTVHMSGDIDDQCDEALKLLKEFKINNIIIETNGVGAMAPAVMIKHSAGSGIGVLGKHTTKNKREKILESFQLPLSTGQLHISTQVAGSKFLKQLRDFNPKYVKSNTHDDFIDAAASAINEAPIRFSTYKPIHSRVDSSWMYNSLNKKYKTKYATL